MGWASVTMLDSLIPVVADPVIGNQRMMVTPSVREKAKEIAETWKKSLQERGGIENVRTPDVHTFFQHLATFVIVKEDDLGFYRKLHGGSRCPSWLYCLYWRARCPISYRNSLAGDSSSMQYTSPMKLVRSTSSTPPPLLRAFLKDAKKAAAAIFEDPNNANLAAREEQSALQVVIVH